MDEKHKFNVDIESSVTKIIHDEEWLRQKEADSVRTNDFEAVVRMFENEHDEKDYEWMSDISMPELPSIILTDASMWANQYFQTRDFVEVRLEGDAPGDDVKCRAAKKAINKTLNRKELYHYPKYIRARTINALNSGVWAVCWWDKEVEEVQKGEYDEVEALDDGSFGIKKVPKMGEKIIKDCFNYEVIDPRNVACDNKYAYSPQEKEWIIIRCERNYEELKAKESEFGYFNLNIIKEWAKTGKLNTSTSMNTYNRMETITTPSIIQNFDIFTRFGKFWVDVKKRTDDGRPVDIAPGYDESGELKDKAEFIECIISIASHGSNKTLIRFQATPYYSSTNVPYRPLVRGLCYIHPTLDYGLGDGKLLRPLVKANNDTYNLSADRTMLATIPTLVGVKASVQDNATIYIAPENVIEVENRGDIDTLKIEDNIQAALQQMGMLTAKMQQVTSIYPTTMGQMPELASTTATAVAGAESRTNLRSNYKSLTFEHTFLSCFYWMILQMTYQFASEETAIAMLGDDAQYFDPNQDYTYQPVSSNIEVEYNKYKKIQNWYQVLGQVVQIQHPDAIKMVNYILTQVCELMGGEYAVFSKNLLNPEIPMAQGQPAGGNGAGGGVPAPQSPMTQNQNQTPMPMLEQFTRGA